MPSPPANSSWSAAPRTSFLPAKTTSFSESGCVITKMLMYGTPGSLGTGEIAAGNTAAEKRLCSTRRCRSRRTSVPRGRAFCPGQAAELFQVKDEIVFSTARYSNTLPGSSTGTGDALIPPSTPNAKCVERPINVMPFLLQARTTPAPIARQGRASQEVARVTATIRRATTGIGYTTAGRIVNLTSRRTGARFPALSLSANRGTTLPRQ